LPNPRKGLQNLVNAPTPFRVHPVGQKLNVSHGGSQRIVDLVRGRRGEAGDSPHGVPFPDGRFGLLAGRDVTGDRRRPDDPPLPAPDRRHRDGHVDAPPVLPYPYSLVVLDPFTASDAFEDHRQLVLRDRDPDWPPPDALAGRVPVEPLGAGVPARDHAIECRADDRVVRGLHDGSGEGQRCFGPAALPESVASGSTIVATVPMTVPIKACSRSDSL